MGAIRACRTAALGGHVARCEGCDHLAVAYNSCRNRHGPKCQGQGARAWLEQRQADLLPVPYRVAISHRRLLALDERGVMFRWKDYRARDGATGGAWIK